MAVRGGKRDGGSRVGAMLVLVGLVGVLGGTFGLGFFTGRHWPRVQVMVGLARPNVQAHAVDPPARSRLSGVTTHGDKARAGSEATGAREVHATRSGAAAREESATRRDGARTEESGSGALATEAPRLTFYQELTAPLASLPRTAPQSSQRPEAPRGTSEPGARSESSSGQRPLERAMVARADGAGERFTIQVAAYGTPRLAETLRGRLAAKGHDAAVSEVATSSGPRWRVRVGTYTSRDDARAAAARLATQMRLEPMVVRDTRDGGR
jgi:cell division protein FtsN